MMIALLLILYMLAMFLLMSSAAVSRYSTALSTAFDTTFKKNKVAAVFVILSLLAVVVLWPITQLIYSLHVTWEDL